MKRLRIVAALLVAALFSAPAASFPAPLDPEIPVGLHALNVPAAWKYATGKGQTVAVLDTGVERDNPDMEGRVKTRISVGGLPLGDGLGHGTHVAGTIAAKRDGKGVVGVAPDSRIVSVRIFTSEGRFVAGDASIVAALDAAVAEGVGVVSLSGGKHPLAAVDPAAYAAVARAQKAGVIVVAAAGNDAEAGFGVSFPASADGVVAVGAVDRKNAVTYFSSRGPEVFVVAPGFLVKSVAIGGGTVEHSGTSMACPHISGLALLWLERNPHVAKAARPAAFRKALAAACSDLGDPGRDEAYGWGLPDAVALLKEQS